MARLEFQGRPIRLVGDMQEMELRMDHACIASVRVIENQSRIIEVETEVEKNGSYHHPHQANLNIFYGVRRP
jgi:hypothetical protein